VLVRESHGFWVCFDNFEVSEWNTDHVFEQPDVNRDMNAYLLLYSRVCADVDLSLSIPEYCRPRIPEDNSRLWPAQTVFGRELYQFVGECSDQPNI
jgi:hypothetical protein